MNFVCSSEVTESLEVSVFTWNDLVLFAKSYKECTPKHFFQVFGKPKTSSEVSVFTWNDLVLFAKSCKECTPKHFFQVFGKPKTSTDRLFCPNQLIWTVLLCKGG